MASHKWLLHNELRTVRGHCVKKKRRGEYSAHDIWTAFFPNEIESKVYFLIINRRMSPVSHQSLGTSMWPGKEVTGTMAGWHHNTPVFIRKQIME